MKASLASPLPIKGGEDLSLPVLGAHARGGTCFGSLERM